MSKDRTAEGFDVGANDAGRGDPASIVRDDASATGYRAVRHDVASEGSYSAGYVAGFERVSGRDIRIGDRVSADVNGRRHRFYVGQIGGSTNCKVLLYPKAGQGDLHGYYEADTCVKIEY